MNTTELQIILDLQNKAYKLLLWLNRQARTRPSLLKVAQMESLESSERCVAWLKRHLNDFPPDLRPATNELQRFGHLFSSFFSTSFRVSEIRDWDDNVITSLSRGAKNLKGRRHKTHSERREKEAADELRRLSLAALAEENGRTLPATALEEALINPAFQDDLTLWTYARELVRRTEFASQGGAVHRLWLSLDETTRKKLSADTVWKARERLVQWVQSLQTQFPGQKE